MTHETDFHTWAEAFTNRFQFAIAGYAIGETPARDGYKTLFAIKGSRPSAREVMILRLYWPDPFAPRSIETWAPVPNGACRVRIPDTFDAPNVATRILTRLLSLEDWEARMRRAE